MRHPHLVERYTVRDVEDSALGRFLVPGPLLHVVGEPPVLAQHLALPPAEIAALENDGVLHPAR